MSRFFEGILETIVDTIMFTCRSAEKSLDDASCRENGLLRD